MRLVTYLKKLIDYPLMAETEILLAPKELSRLGYLSLEEVNKAATICEKPILVWDILMTQRSFDMARKHIEAINLDLFYAVRVQDAGALNFLLENYPEINIQLILENGNHNEVGILSWASLVGKKLERVILSIELPRDILKNYVEKLSLRKIKTEILAMGPVLLFYSPRSLLSPLVQDKKDNLSALANSKESAHRGFRIHENIHGTFMYNIRDQFILDELNTLKEIGIDYIRADVEGSLIPLIRSYLASSSAEVLQEIKNIYPQKMMHGFFSSNKTDVLFRKLKNYRIARVDGNYLGEVVDVQKKSIMGISIKGYLEKNDHLEIKTPEGKCKKTVVSQMFNSCMESIDRGEPGSIVFIPHLGGVSVRSAVFKA